jgi:hypothetical protein
MLTLLTRSGVRPRGERLVASYGWGRCGLPSARRSLCLCLTLHPTHPCLMLAVGGAADGQAICAARGSSTSTEHRLVLVDYLLY